jgi:hypothetical protein
MEASGQLRVLAALPPGKHSGAHGVGGCVGPRHGFNILEKGEKCVSPFRIQSWDRPARIIASIPTVCSGCIVV